MSKIRENFRLHAAKLSSRQIAASVAVARSSVAECLRRAELAGIAWPLADDVDEAMLERRLYPPVADTHERASVDWAWAQRALRRRGVTLMLLWQEYNTQHPDGYQYSRFCDLYRAWLSRVDVVMRQEHRAGERLFVDYAGQTDGSSS